MKRSVYFQQAHWMLRVLSHVRLERHFALKGGTAINFFIQNVPRLSVDIDLTYLPLDSREAALRNISDSLSRIAGRLEQHLPDVRVRPLYALEQPRRMTKLFIQTPAGQIKIEPNEVLRGALFPAEERSLMPEAQKLFELALSTPVLSVADLYGGKICAALDRQHPRDLFDIKMILETDGFPDAVRKAFVVYLASHDRPLHELLNPVRKDIRGMFESGFVGMTTIPIAFDELVQAREALIERISRDLTAMERQFLLSLKAGEPEWALLGVAGADRLPAIQWKLRNIRRMEKSKHKRQLQALQRCLGL